MSRGPGRIERTIRALFDASPDEAFTTDDLCQHCYGLAPEASERKHRVAVIRAADKVVAGHLDWRILPRRGRMLVYRNAASLPSVALADALDAARGSGEPPAIAMRAKAILDGADRSHLERRERLDGEVRRHIAARDASAPAEAARLLMGG